MGDVWGPAHVESIGMWKYYVSLTNDAKQYVMTLLYGPRIKHNLRSKNICINIIKKYSLLPKYLWFNNGKKLVNEEVKRWAAKGIIIEITAPYSPSQNGVAKRLNWTLLKLACAMLFEKNLSIFLWDKAVAHAAYLHN